MTPLALIIAIISRCVDMYTGRGSLGFCSKEECSKNNITVFKLEGKANQAIVLDLSLRDMSNATTGAGRHDDELLPKTTGIHDQPEL